MSKKDSCSYIDSFPQMRLLCIGDMMLDISPKAKPTEHLIFLSTIDLVSADMV